jgi:hypothetical protein
LLCEAGRSAAAGRSRPPPEGKRKLPAWRQDQRKDRSLELINWLARASAQHYSVDHNEAGIAAAKLSLHRSDYGFRKSSGSFATLAAIYAGCMQGAISICN